MLDSPDVSPESPLSSEVLLADDSNSKNHPTELTPSIHPSSKSPSGTFRDMGVREEILTALDSMGFTKPFPVQAETYRPILLRQDLIIQARTGSGKTAAFGIPLMQEIIDPLVATNLGRIQGLILVPTRELALQVSSELERIGAHLKLQVISVYGGAPMGPQLEALSKGAHIVVGTPGRILDHLRRGTLDLSQIRVLVLDEADQMFSQGFYDDIQEIIQKSPSQRQTLLFSATMPYEVERLCQRVMHNPIKIHLSTDSVGAPDIKHSYYMVSGMARTRDLLRVLDLEAPESAIIFCNTREETREVTEFLRTHGLDAKSISGSLTQKEREKVMALMRSNKLQYLVATDIAARGIDISHVTHVINYTFPESAEVYIHRTGRTGRAGRAGAAISLIGPRELANFYTFKLTYKIHPTEQTLPTTLELQTLRENHYLVRLQKELVRKPNPLFYSLVKRVLDSPEGERLLAVLVERYVTSPLPSEEIELAKEEASLQGMEKTPEPTETSPSSLQERHPQREGYRREPTRKAPDLRRSPSGRTTKPSAEHHGKTIARTPVAREHATIGETQEAPELRAGSNERKRKSKSRALSSPVKATPSVPSEIPPSNGVGLLSGLAQTAPSAAPVHEPIQVTEGREYWEAWVDSRQLSVSPSLESSEKDVTSDVSVKDTPESSSVPTLKEGTGSHKTRPRKMPVSLVSTEGGTEEPKTPKVYLNLGKRHGLNQERLQAFLAERGLPSFPTQIRLTHSYILPPEEKIEEIVTALHGQSLENRTILCERARK